ncbi:MAG: hypothetical protein OEU92_32015, partial [Alphaproteobacteria bacterium]|nr:hypothetical protein [Alphaproteobacteria bacterium]
LVKCDEDGFFYFIGRRDSLIKSAGFRISPTEVEEVVCCAGAVRQAAVVGVPDTVLGQHLVAFVIPWEQTNTLDPNDILTHCATKLPRHMVPKRIVVSRSIPTTSSGKVDYTALQAAAIEEVEAEPEIVADGQVRRGFAHG